MTALVDVDGLTGGRLGTFDVPCPVCGPNKRSPSNRRRPVLRIWRIEPSFAGFRLSSRIEPQSAHGAGRKLKPPPNGERVISRNHTRKRRRALLRRAGRRHSSNALFTETTS